MEREETRGAAAVARPRATAGGIYGASGTKLPLLLTARPGNVGVQIDAFRTMKLFNRPRCGKFTAQFQGVNYENHSMENYARVVERTHARARIVAERLEKLKQHEAKLVADEQSRQKRLKERERAEQRRQWLTHQAAKKVEQREREDCAARIVQRVARGSIARRYVRSFKETKIQHYAARCLQQSIRQFVSRRQSMRRCQERDKARRHDAARTIQRHTRTRQASGRHVMVLETAATEPVQAEGGSQSDDDTMVVSESACLSSADEPLSVSITQDADEALLLELVLPTPSPDFTTHVGFTVPTPPQPRPLQPNRPLAHPRRPVTIKRVGGGFRQSAAFQSPRLRTSRPPILTGAISPRPPPRMPLGVYDNRSGVQNNIPVVGGCRQEPHEANLEDNALLDLFQQVDTQPLELAWDSGIHSGT